MKGKRGKRQIVRVCGKDWAQLDCAKDEMLLKIRH